jgi:hypothetical protein
MGIDIATAAADYLMVQWLINLGCGLWIPAVSQPRSTNAWNQYIAQLNFPYFLLHVHCMLSRTAKKLRRRIVPQPYSIWLTK